VGQNPPFFFLATREDSYREVGRGLSEGVSCSGGICYARGRLRPPAARLPLQVKGRMRGEREGGEEREREGGEERKREEEGGRGRGKRKSKRKGGRGGRRTKRGGRGGEREGGKERKREKEGRIEFVHSTHNATTVSKETY